MSDRDNYVDNGADDDQGRPMGGRRYVTRPKFCQFCSDKNLVIDYKATDVLRKFTMEDGRIRPRRQTGTCALHQRALARAIKRARHLALLPFSGGTWEDNLR
jgi:small subunit ribosomal protein S18